MLNNLEKYDIVLGSNSPRRRELLNDMGLTFRVESIKGIDETYPASLPV
ncbi:MAG: Maf family protein, partial [Muribaculaceae bacterium]|nr:Maf family protein [Muribaculaceae bacterium]